MAGKSLGPFPKTMRWREIVADALPPGRRSETVAASDQMLHELLASYERLVKDPVAIRVITHLVSLPVATRSKDSLVAAPPVGGDLVVLAGRATVARFEERTRMIDPLFDSNPWRAADGAGFCDLARMFFTELNRAYFRDALARWSLQVPDDVLDRFAEEMSLITRSFSARWFNACARYQTPESGSIAWYLGHCLGKLDLELSRELSTWEEPKGNPWRRRKADSGQAVFSF